MNRHRIMSNVLMMSMGQIVTWGLSLVYFVVVGRYLGPNRFGELALAKAIVAVLWLGATLGMETYITRSVARTPERAGALVSAAIMARTALAVPVLAGVYLYTHLAHVESAATAAAYVYALAEILWSAEKVLLAVFQGRERMSLTTIAASSRNILTLVLGVAVIVGHGGVVAIAATEVPTAALLLGVTLYWMRNFGRLTVRVPVRDLREIVVGGLGFWAHELFFTVYLYVDSVILAGLAGTTAVGIYTPATQFFSVPMFLTGIIGPATLPQLSRLGVERGEDFRRAARKVFSIFIAAGVPFTIGLTTFAGPLILTVLGPAYHRSEPVLVILSLAILPMFLNFQFGQVLAASDRQWWWAAALGGACILNPVLNFMLVPTAQSRWHNAALGAALAWLITELLEVIYGGVLLPDVVLNRFLGRVLLGAFAAGAVQGSVLWLLGSHLPVSGGYLGAAAFAGVEAIAVAAYSLVVLALGVIPRDDVQLLLETALRRMRRRGAQARVAAAE